MSDVFGRVRPVPENPNLSAIEFATKWRASTRTERAAAQEHFIDLCRMIGVATPNEADPTGDWYAFEKGARKEEGGDGFADVWKRNHFAWEYKKKRANLGEAYKQLLQYREALENPPLLIVCDLNRFEIHTNFTGTKKLVYDFTLDDLLTAPAEPLRLLRAVMKDPDSLKPQQTRAQITEDVATRFAELAERLGPEGRGNEPHAVAHFLTKLLFCLFAEDVGLLPHRLFQKLVETTQQTPELFAAQIKTLFEKMATKPGGHFGVERIEWFDGGLFADTEAIPLEKDDLALVWEAAKMDWSAVEPAILGTLFERGLDPKKRSQLGAHYTDKESILRVVEPVVMQPLRREFETMKAAVMKMISKVKLTGANRTTKEKEAATKATKKATMQYRAFLDRLRTVTVLDPACGSGNFLYVTLQLVKDLEKQAILWAAETLKTTQEFPLVGPQIVHGIEVNAYAAELARVTIWVGQIQWMINNGFNNPTNPVLQPLQSIEQRDAILDQSDSEHPCVAKWPDAEFIVGNPPILGGKKMRGELGDEYVDALFEAWHGAVPREADLVTYWHEKARQQISDHRAKRAGLLATQGIRGGANQKILQRIRDTGQIFAAWSDEPWVVEGASLHVSIVAQDDGRETARFLDGKPVERINADLTPGGSGKLDLTQAKPLKENFGVSFMGDTKGGPFEITRDQARKAVTVKGNPHGKPNTDVVRPWINGFDITRRPLDRFILDFGEMTEKDAALYEAPFQLATLTIKPKREASRSTRKQWWHHERRRPEMLKALGPLARFIVATTLSKYRLFTWVRSPTLPDHQLIVIAREDDYAFGVLHSRVHAAWALQKGTQLEDRPRYTPTSTFETFAFPWPLDTPDADLTEEQRAHREAIAAAAKDLDDKRNAWLNPPELIKVIEDVPLPPRLVPVDEAAANELKERTLTKLYNQRPGWLDMLHEELDRQVLAAYRLPDNVSNDDLLAELLKLNLARAAG
jgi:type II restriction/modification system DNA methylase subunit YeeA